MALEYKLMDAIESGDDTIETLILEKPSQAKLEDAGLDYVEMTKAKGLRCLLVASCTNAVEPQIMNMSIDDVLYAGTMCKEAFFR